MYAELAAVDRLSFQQIYSNNFICSAMVKQGLPSHTSSTTVGHKVFQYYDETKVIMMNHLQMKSVIRDCKTRWSSLHSMAERFLLLEGPLNKVLNDLGLEKLKLSFAEIQLVREIVAALEPFKVATEYL